MNEYTRVSPSGDKYYYKDKAMTILHREDGPAIEGYGGTNVWYLNDKVHRMDGPALVSSTFKREWWINDVFIFEIDNNGNIIDRME